MRQKLFIVFLVVFGSHSVSAHLFEHDSQSFAKEYKELRVLLQKVTTEEAAIKHKPAIQMQISILKKNQFSGESSFAALSDNEQALFVKKFQNNRFHCGEVTQVMAEKQRILLHLDISKILRDVLSQIP